MTQYVIDFDNASETKENVKCSSAPTKHEQKFSQELNEAFEEKYGMHFKEKGYQKVNFSVEMRKNTIVVKESFWVRENGSVEIVDIGHKHYIKGHSIRTRLRKKVSELAMSIHIPTPILLFHKEFESFFKDGFLLNISASTFFGGLLVLAGMTTEQLYYSYFLLFIMGILDWILVKFPSSIVGEKNKDDRFIYKMQVLFFNMFLMTGIFITHTYLSNNISDPNIVQKLMINYHYIGIQILIVPYYGRVLKYFFIANKIKTPAAVTNYFNNIFKK